MMRTYLIIMAIATFIIGFALAIKMCIKVLETFKQSDTLLSKCASILNLLAALTLGSAFGILFLQVANLS